MKSFLWMCFVGSLTAICQPQAAQTQAELADSLGYRSANALVAELARLIKQYGHFSGNQYNTWADTTKGLKLYVSVKVEILGKPGDINYWYSPAEWDYIDFMQPIKPDELKILVGRNDNFVLDASKKIVRRATPEKLSGRPQREKHRRLTVFFFTDRPKRPTDFGKLHSRISKIVQLLADR